MSETGVCRIQLHSLWAKFAACHDGLFSIPWVELDGRIDSLDGLVMTPALLDDEGMFCLLYCSSRRV